MLPYSACQLCSYETYKRLLGGGPDGQGLSVPRRLAAGAAAGMTSTLVRAQLTSHQILALVSNILSCRSRLRRHGHNVHTGERRASLCPYLSFAAYQSFFGAASNVSAGVTLVPLAVSPWHRDTGTCTYLCPQSVALYWLSLQPCRHYQLANATLHLTSCS